VESNPYMYGKEYYYGEEYKKAPYPINIMCQVMIEKGFKELTEEIHAPYLHPNPFDSYEERSRKEDLLLKDNIWIGKTDDDKYIALDRDSINHHHFDYISGFDSGYAIVYKSPKKYTRYNWEGEKKMIIKGGWGIIDRDGNLLTPDPEDLFIDEIWSFYDMGQKGTILHSNTLNPEGDYFYFRFKVSEYDDENFGIIDKKQLKEYKEERERNYDRYLGPEEEEPDIEDWKRYTSTGEEWEIEDW